jgi:hypothetical protein
MDVSLTYAWVGFTQARDRRGLFERRSGQQIAFSTSAILARSGDSRTQRQWKRTPTL